MEIISKYGKKNETCPICKSILKLEATDLTADETGEIRKHHNGANCYYECPVCKNIVPLHSRTLPKQWIPIIFDNFI